MSTTTESECAPAYVDIFMSAFYRRIAFQNLVRASQMSYGTNKPSETDTSNRARMTKQIAEYLLDEHGPLAYTLALDKVETEPHPQMWRDVLAWLDDINKERSNVSDL